MSDHALLATVFWALYLLDGALAGRRARFALLSWFGGPSAQPAWRRWHLLSPWPGGWRMLTDDVPFSFSPAGICNRPAGTAGRPANEPGHVQAWRWEDIADVSEVGGQLVINGKIFCAATGHMRADELHGLAVACTPLPSDARAKLLNASLRLWLRPAHLRRRAAVLRTRTSLLVWGNLLALVGAVILTAAFLGRLPEQVVITQTSLGISLLLLHAVLIGLAWWERGHLLRLVHRSTAVNNPLMGALFFPPSALRLRALLSAEWFPVSHPVAVALAFAPHTARDELIFNAFADLRWPLVSPGDGDGPLVSEVLTWFRAALERELEELLIHERVDVAILFAPPAPDGATSRSYCPRCRAQFVAEGGSCPNAIALRPLK